MKRFSLIFSLLCCLFFLHIGTRPLANPDEGRYASMGLEMLQTGDWIVPRLNGLIYFEKPPLGYWSIALGQWIFGSNFWGARFFNALFSLLTCDVLYGFCKRFLSTKVGLWAALIYGTAALPVGMSQVLTLDNALTFFLTTTLLLFASGFLEKDKRISKIFFFLAYTFMAFTILTKGLIGIVLPGIIGLPWLIYTGYIKQLSRAHLVKGLLWMVVVAAPWHYLVQQRYNCFFNFYFWHEHFERYFTSVHGRSKPFYFLINAFLLGTIPWLFFLPRSICTAVQKGNSVLENRVIFFSIWWSVSLVLFFVCSDSQLIPYILPVISGISITLAYGLSKIDLNKTKWECSLWALGYFSLGLALPFILEKKAIVPLSYTSILSIRAVLVINTVIAIIFVVKKTVKKAFVTLLCTTILIYLILPFYLPNFTRLNAYNVCKYLKARESKSVDVFCIYDYFNDIPFYLKQNIGVVECCPDEHTLGLRVEPSERYISMHLFKERWQQTKPCYAVVKRGQEAKFEQDMNASRYFQLMQDHFFTLYSNEL